MKIPKGKILICGLGSIGKRHIENLIKLGFASSNIIIFRTQKGTKEFGDEFLKKNPDLIVVNSLDKALQKKPFLAVVSNPTALHVATAIKAAAAGSHVFVEKPLSDSLVGINRLKKVLARKKVSLFVGFNHRFHPLLIAFKKFIGAGKIGNIIDVNARLSERITDWHSWESYAVSYASRKKLGGGAIMTQSHETDFLYWIFGKPNWIFASGGTFGNLPMDVENSVSTIFNYKTFVATLHLDYFSRPPIRYLETIGTLGRLYWDYGARVLTLTLLNGKTKIIKQPKKFQRNDMFLAEMKHFLDCLTQEKTSMSSINDAINVQKILGAVKKSMQTKKAISL